MKRIWIWHICKETQWNKKCSHWENKAQNDSKRVIKKVCEIVVNEIMIQIGKKKRKKNFQSFFFFDHFSIRISLFIELEEMWLSNPFQQI